MSTLDEHTEAPGGVAATQVVIRLFGPVRVEVDGRERRPRRAPTGEFIAYLALRSQGATRDRLLEALWPGQDPHVSRERLWQSASESRSLIGSGLRREGERYRLDRRSVAVDVESLEGALAPERGTEPLAIERALGLFQGEPLEDVEGAWALGHVRRLSGLFVDACERAGQLQLARGEALRALFLAERGLSFDQLNERLVRLAMAAETELGLRLAVQRRYACLRETLTEALGVEPARETRVYYRRLLAQS